MKEVLIKSKIINMDAEKLEIETTGTYKENDREIEYKEEELLVNVKILKDSIILNRKNEEYDLNLEFKENCKFKCKYNIKSIGMNFDLIVYTEKLIIEQEKIFIKYELFDEEKSIGNFEYELIYKEG